MNRYGEYRGECQEGGPSGSTRWPSEETGSEMQIPRDVLLQNPFVQSLWNELQALKAKEPRQESARGSPSPFNREVEGVLLAEEEVVNTATLHCQCDSE